MSFSRRHSTGPNCWGDDQVQEANHPPITASSYWNGFCNVKSVGVRTSVRKQRTKQVLRLEIKHPKGHHQHNLHLDTFNSFLCIITLIVLTVLSQRILILHFANVCE